MTDIKFYWRPGCGFCRMLEHSLAKHDVAVTKINIWEDPDAAAIVRGHARGNETVPTVVIGSVGLVNPSAKEVIAEAGAQGVL